MVNAITERKTKARGPRRPQGKAKSTKTPAMAFDIEAWMQGMEAASDVELGWSEGEECGYEWQNVHPQHGGRNKKRHSQ